LSSRSKARAGAEPAYTASHETIDLLVSTEAEVDIDAETLAAINEGVQAADEGRVLPAEAVPNLMSQWISKFSTQNRV